MFKYKKETDKTRYWKSPSGIKYQVCEVLDCQTVASKGDYKRMCKKHYHKYETDLIMDAIAIAESELKDEFN
jgi:hypothetical protein